MAPDTAAWTCPHTIYANGACVKCGAREPTTAAPCPCGREDDPKCSPDSAALHAENERLRCALRAIADCPNPDSVSGCHDMMWQIASEALDPPDEDKQQGCT